VRVGGSWSSGAAMSKAVSLLGSGFETGKGFMLILEWWRIYIDNIVSANERWN